MIRPLELKDKEQFIRLMKMFFDERLSHDGAEFSQESADQQFDVFFNTPGVYGIVSEKDGDVVGAIILTIGPVLFGKGLMAQELVWYVEPAHRGCGLRLIRAAEEFAKNKGCKVLIVCGMEGDKSNEFYIRDGYKLLQNSYQKRMV
jgi:GNAT superfamily N-acetyltransferase